MRSSRIPNSRGERRRKKEKGPGRKVESSRKGKGKGFFSLFRKGERGIKQPAFLLLTEKKRGKEDSKLRLS